MYDAIGFDNDAIKNASSIKVLSRALKVQIKSASRDLRWIRSCEVHVYGSKVKEKWIKLLIKNTRSHSAGLLPVNSKSYESNDLINSDLGHIHLSLFKPVPCFREQKLVAASATKSVQRHTIW